MKKIFFAALALLVVMASCVKDEPYYGVTISGLSFTPTAMTDVNDVTVTANIASFYDVKATLCYVLNETEKINEVPMLLDDATQLYTAVIPAQPNDTKVVFYVKAASEKMEVTSESKDYTVGAVPPDYSVIVLNELNGTDKFIELYNTGDMDLPLRGMYIEKDAKKIIWTADENVIAPAHGFLLLYSSDVTGEGDDHEGYTENLIFDSGLSPKKTLKIELFMPDGESRDVFTRGNDENWGTTISDVSPNSFARTPDGGEWKLTEPTPGTANPATGDPIPQD
ncbi:MAG: lamin tail domain-containing protein [Bacteroidales bacterium]|nr:lamin tail domain-containing protein [Bacteroidales bacterium]